MNPCPCGYFGDDRKECTCGLGNVQRYQSRISGPLMDRIDIHTDVMRVPFEKLASLDGGETSAVIRARVEAARKIQAARFAPVGKPYVLVNGDMGPAEVQQFCDIDEAGKNLMRMAVRRMDLIGKPGKGRTFDLWESSKIPRRKVRCLPDSSMSVRSCHRVLKLSRTIADLAGEEAIAVEHLAEALQYRPRGII